MSEEPHNTETHEEIGRNLTKNILIIVGVFVIIIGICIVAVISSYFYYLNEIDKPIKIDGSDRLTLTIEKGMGIEEISTLLTEKGVISRPEVLKAYMFLNKDKVIQAGYYNLDLIDLNLINLVEIFQKGSFEKKLTFPEGWRVEQYKDYLAEELGDDFAQKFIDSSYVKEGYMFPDTYIVENDYLPENLASFMRNTFDKKITQELIDEAALNGLSLDEVVILASIIEREMNNPKDRPIVAGILIKRLRENWFLNADATIQYAKGTEEDWWPKVSVADYQGYESPYNTYTNKGLPPAPISNPSLNAIESVVNYVESPYYYYISDTNGVTRYAETLEEHRENIRKYLN